MTDSKSSPSSLSLRPRLALRDRLGSIDRIRFLDITFVLENGTSMRSQLNWSVSLYVHFSIRRCCLAVVGTFQGILLNFGLFVLQEFWYFRHLRSPWIFRLYKRWNIATYVLRSKDERNLEQPGRRIWMQIQW